MGVDLSRARALHDARTGLLPRRDGPLEERARHVDAVDIFAIGLISTIRAIVGFTVVFGDSGNARIGNFDHVLLWNVTDLDGDIAGMALVAFQMMFGVITGATADRLRFGSYAVLIGIWSLLMYVPVAKWVWNGWILDMGALDFAGGTAIHINAGVAALAVVLAVGNRRGRGTEPMPPHNLPLTVLGMGILSFGWIGFNAGSALAANGVAAQAVVNTHLAAVTGMLGCCSSKGSGPAMPPRSVPSPGSSRSRRSPDSWAGRLR